MKPGDLRLIKDPRDKVFLYPWGRGLEVVKSTDPMFLVGPHNGAANWWVVLTPRGFFTVTTDMLKGWTVAA
jgi:hypothetical protein